MQSSLGMAAKTRQGSQSFLQSAGEDGLVTAGDQLHFFVA
jgi:hypothetical protein